MTNLKPKTYFLRPDVAIPLGFALLREIWQQKVGLGVGRVLRVPVRLLVGCKAGAARGVMEGSGVRVRCARQLAMQAALCGCLQVVGRPSAYVMPPDHDQPQPRIVASHEAPTK